MFGKASEKTVRGAVLGRGTKYSNNGIDGFACPYDADAFHAFSSTSQRIYCAVREMCLQGLVQGLS